jgi:hypothetical protein
MDILSWSQLVDVQAKPSMRDRQQVRCSSLLVIQKVMIAKLNTLKTSCFTAHIAKLTHKRKTCRYLLALNQKI